MLWSIFHKKWVSGGGRLIYFAIFLSVFLEVVSLIINKSPSLYYVLPFKVFAYNFILTLICGLLYLQFIFLQIRRRVNKRTIQCLQFLLLFTFILNFVIKTSSLFVLNAWVMSVCAISIIVAVSIFLIEQLKDEQLFELKFHYSFWVSLGLLLFYVGSLPSLLVYKFLNTDIFGVMMMINSILLYGCFIIGIVWSKKI